VPLNGFWKTRPIRCARRCSGQRVTSRPASRIVPASTENAPATALRSVDFPEPLVPTTTRNEPSSSVRSTPRSARTSFGVPWLKVFATPRSSSTATSPQPPADLGERERREHEDRGDQLQVVRVEPGAERDRDQESEDERPHERAGYDEPHLVRADQCLPDDDAREPPDHHADPHLHVGEPLVLGKQRPGEGNEADGDLTPEDAH